MKNLFRMMLIACLVLPFAACKKAEAPKEPAKPLTADDIPVEISIGKILVVLDRDEDVAWLSLRNVPTVHALAVDHAGVPDAREEVVRVDHAGGIDERLQRLEHAQRGVPRHVT